MIEEKKCTMEALQKAVDCFRQYLENKGFDSAYWKIHFQADMLDSEFKESLFKVVIEE